jgi:hypothetical protein
LIQEGTDVENTTEIESNIDADPTFISKYDIYESSELDHKVTNVENKIQIGGDTHSDVNFFQNVPESVIQLRKLLWKEDTRMIIHQEIIFATETWNQP